MTGRQRRIVIGLVIGVAVLAGPAAAQTADPSSLSLEDLLRTQVTADETVDRALFGTAASIHVINRQDIMSYGAETVPDLLRMVPGLWVAQLDATTWHVSARGGDAVVVLIDGHLLSSPLFPMQWDALNFPLREIERVEVGRGASGMLWGVNAVVTVVSITTRSWAASAGGLLTGALNTPDNGVTSARYVARIADKAHVRVHGSFTRRGTGAFEGESRPDLASIAVGDVRLNWRGARSSLGVRAWMQNGETHHLRASTDGTPGGASDGAFREGSTSLSWTRASASVDLTAQGQYRSFERRGHAADEQWQFADGQMRSRWTIDARHAVTSGMIYALAAVAPNRTAPRGDRIHAASAFLEVDMTLARGVVFTPGVTAERNRYAGFAVQPAVRLMWQPTATQAVWAKAARGLATVSREPSRPADARDPVVYADRVNDAEAGYRVEVGRVSLDVATFAGRRREVELGSLTASPAIAVRGAELSATWRPIEQWSLAGSYSAVRVSGATPAHDRFIPSHQAQVRTAFVVRDGTQLNAAFYALSAPAGTSVPGYAQLDIRLEHELSEQLEMSLGARNLLHGGTREFWDRGVRALPVASTVFAEVEWGF